MATPTFDTIEAQASYGIGLQVGQQLSESGLEGLLPEALVAGIADALEGKHPAVPVDVVHRARVADGATVVSTSTRNFPNRLGTGANVFLASAELAAVAALIGKLPTPEEYQTYVAQVDKTAVDTYRYLNFDQLSQYTEKADGVIFQTAV